MYNTRLGGAIELKSLRQIEHLNMTKVPYM